VTRLLGLGQIGSDIDRREDKAQAGDHDDSRPDDLPGGNVQIHPRHPEIAGGD
jgi:hypothetical protein